MIRLCNMNKNPPAPNHNGLFRVGFEVMILLSLYLRASQINADTTRNPPINSRGWGWKGIIAPSTIVPINADESDKYEPG